MRSFRTFSFKEAYYRVSECALDSALDEITNQRRTLESFIAKNREFKYSLTPLESIPADAPPIALRMYRASLLVGGVGPMAAVAGSFAQSAAEAAIERGCSDVVVENGGDIFMVLDKEIILGIYSGETSFGDSLAFRITPEETPLAVCSSSSTMGHSLSFGRCSLATVFAGSGALADAAATYACNLVKTESDINNALEQIMSIEGIRGVMIIKDDKIGLAGEVPELIKTMDTDLTTKVTRAPGSNFDAFRIG